MKLFKSALPFFILGMLFITIGIVLGDPKQFGFGVAWFLIAAAKQVLITRKEKQIDQMDKN